MTLSVVTSKVYTSQGVGISVVGTAQVKINGASEEMLRYAAEQFGSKSEEELTHICKLTMEAELETKPSRSVKLSRKVITEKALLLLKYESGSSCFQLGEGDFIVIVQLPTSRRYVSSSTWRATSAPSSAR